MKSIVDPYEFRGSSLQEGESHPEVENFPVNYIVDPSQLTKGCGPMENKKVDSFFYDQDREGNPFPSGKKDFFSHTKMYDDDIIYLRPIARPDINDAYMSWFHDQETTKYNSHGKFPMGIFDSTEFLFDGKNDKIVFAIIDKATEKHIGNVALQEIDFINRKAEITFLIGDKDFSNKGYAKRAGGMALRHAFEKLNLHRVYLGFAESNVKMKSVAEKLQFSREGRFAEAFLIDGQFMDIELYSLLSFTYKIRRKD